MALDEERLIVSLEARINQFEKNMKKAEQRGTRSYTKLRGGSAVATRQMERDMIRSTTAMNHALATTSARVGTFSKAMAAGFIGGAVTLGISAVTTNLGGMMKAIASVGDEARRAGVGLQEFQEWKYVAEQNRIGVDSLVDGMKELNLRADEFIETGKGPAAEAFARLGFGAGELGPVVPFPTSPRP